MPDGMLADGLADRRFAEIEAYPGLEPSPLALEQADHCNRRMAEPFGETDDVVETDFRRRVQKVSRMECVKAFTLICHVDRVCNPLLARQGIYPSKSNRTPALADISAVVSELWVRLIKSSPPQFPH